jgi:hypothetical protein
VYVALERLDVDEELLAIVGIWRDMLDDAEVLALLRVERGPGRCCLIVTDNPRALFRD